MVLDKLFIKQIKGNFTTLKSIVRNRLSLEGLNNEVIYD